MEPRPDIMRQFGHEVLKVAIREKLTVEELYVTLGCLMETVMGAVEIVVRSHGGQGDA